MSVVGRRALGVAVGLLLDRALGEPPDRWHPVAWFGTVMGRVERWGYADTRLAGARHAAVGAGLGVGSGLALAGVLRRVLGQGSGDVASTAVAVAVASAGRMLRDTSTDIEALLAGGDLAGARARLPWLVGRDPSELDASGVCAAVIESLAENTVDAVIAPAWWGVVAGAPGVLLHRGVNTLDAMVGHRIARYARFGTASARLDDLLAWGGARKFAGLVALDALARRGPRGLAHVLRVVRRDAPAHPSPNSGVAEASAAAALGLELGGPLRYGERVELRPRLGDGPRPQPADITRARALVDRVELIMAAGCVAVWWVDRGLERRHTRRRTA